MPSAKYFDPGTFNARTCTGRRRAHRYDVYKMNQEEFERSFVRFLTNGPHPGLDLLRLQYDRTSVVSRESTGVGFFTYYELQDGTCSRFCSDFQIGDVLIEADDLEMGAGAMIAVKNGHLHSLEGYSYGDAWSINFPNLTLTFTDATRNLTMISEIVPS